MSFWKILTGVATGVGVVALLPAAGTVLGPAFAITKLGALAGGALGGMSGAAIDALDDSEEQAEKRGEARERAKHAKKLGKIQDYMETMGRNAKDWNQFGEKLIAMSAVGFACANCDGEIHPQERIEIAEFTAGVGHSGLPPHVKERLHRFERKPPNLKTAFVLSEKAKVDLSILDDVIDVVMHADGRVHPNEIAFMKAWHQMTGGPR